MLVSQVEQLIEDKVVSALREQQASISDQLLTAMRSQATTPVPQTPATPDPQQTQAHILQLLRQGQLNAAFQQVNRTLIGLESKLNNDIVKKISNVICQICSQKQLNMMMQW